MTSSDPSSATERLLAERYGRRTGGPRRSVVVAVAVAALAGLGWLAWAASSAVDSDVDADVTTWEVVSPHEVEVEIVIHRGSGDAVACTLAAQASDASVVGEREVELPAGEPGEHRLEVRVETEREATAVRISDCR